MLFGKITSMAPLYEVFCNYNKEKQPHFRKAETSEFLAFLPKTITLIQKVAH